MKLASLEPANSELSELYNRDVQSFNRLAQLNLSNHFTKKEFFSPALGNPILMIFFK